MQYSRHNYGALLQAAALEAQIRALTPDAIIEHIDARPAWLMHSRPESLRQWCSSAKRLLKQFLNGWKGLPDQGNFHVFSDFRSQYIQLTSKVYVDQEDFDKENWDYDLVVVGSDQVFRIKMMKSRADAFFLRFLPESCRRVAYAASFGVDHWEGADDPEFTSKIRGALVQFESISVRESSGVQICKETFDLDVTHVLDPTLLIGREYFDTIIDEADVVVTSTDWAVHCISDDALYISEVPGLAKTLSKEVKDIYYHRHECWPLPPRAKFNTVPEWLAAIRGAREQVFTDSYHAVCFCILFEKDFLVFISKDKGPGRILSLLRMLGLENRICESSEALIDAANGENSIDYKLVGKKLSELRTDSLNYLKKSIT